jgi:FkbM family methyltransferase
MKIAFVKFGGLSSGGTERWLQYMAKGLGDRGYEIDFFYCDSAPYRGSNYVHPDTDQSRLKYLMESNVNLFKFSVGEKDVTKYDHEWLETDFWEVFDESRYDFVQTAKAGPPEYPFNRMKISVIELVALDAGFDNSSNIVWSSLVSQTQRARWVQSGGSLSRSNVIPVPVFAPTTNENLRDSLGIPTGDVVAGFHQAPRDEIYSDLPLRAFALVYSPNRHFIILSGSNKYRQQAREMGLKNVHFLNFNSEPDCLSLFLNTLDVFAHGRKDGETFGTVFAEAMIHGKPCLSHTSPKGSNGHIETIGPAGYVCKNLESYSRRLDDLYSNLKLRNKLGEDALEHSTLYYSYESAVDELVNVYESVRSGTTTLQKSPRVPYALSSLGFLQAGALNDPSSISHHTLVGGIPEEFDLRISDFFALQSSAYIDIGANIGLYSPRAKAINHSLDVHAFEPQNNAAEILMLTQRLNKWDSGFKVHQVALSDHDGLTTLHLAGTGSTLEPRFLGTDTPSLQVRVETKSMDEFRTEINFKNAFVKVGVEGHELKVLEGANKIILADRPTWFIEIAETLNSRSFTNPDFEDIFNKMQIFNYRCFVSDGVKSIKKFRGGMVADGVNMYLFIPKERSLYSYCGLQIFLFRKRTLKIATRIKNRLSILIARIIRGFKRKLKLGS